MTNYQRGTSISRWELIIYKLYFDKIEYKYRCFKKRSYLKMQCSLCEFNTYL